MNGVPAGPDPVHQRAGWCAPRPAGGADGVGDAVHRVTVSFPTVYDVDNISLTYNVFRGTTNVGSWNRYSYWWTRPTMTTFSDTGLTSGQTVAYRVEVTDGRNVRKSAVAKVRILKPARSFSAGELGGLR